MDMLSLFKKKTPDNDTGENRKQTSDTIPDWKNPDRDIACSAVSRITDQGLLIQIVKEKNRSVEHEAQVRLQEILSPDTKQEVLFEIADSFRYVPLRIKAAEMLEDQDLLTTIANKQYFLGDEINEAARKKLTKLTASCPVKEGTLTIEHRSECKAGSDVVFGKWDGIPLTWKVLAAEEDRMLLLCNDLLGNRAFNYEKPATWDISQLRKDLNGEWFYNNPEVFSQAERDLILTVSNDSPGISYQNQTTWDECYADKGNDVEDRVFILSCNEAMQYFSGETVIWQPPMSDNRFKFYSSPDLAAPHPWWLRNATRRNSAAVIVTVQGVINCEGFSVDNTSVPEVRPAVWIAR